MGFSTKDFGIFKISSSLAHNLQPKLESFGEGKGLLLQITLEQQI